MSTPAAPTLVPHPDASRAPQSHEPLPLPHPFPVPLPERFRRQLDAVNSHFQPAGEFARLLALQHARALWNEGRTDEEFAAHIDLIMAENWDQANEEYEELDLHAHSVLAAATLATRRASRRRLSDARRQLTRMELTLKLLQSPNTQA